MTDAGFEEPSPATLACERCGEQCGDPLALAVHLERHRPVLSAVLNPATGTEMSHRCPGGCGRSFIRPLELREHSAACDGSVPIPASPPGPVEVRPFICPECGEEFTKPELLAPHLERHRETEPPKYTRRGKLKSRQCPLCGRHFGRAPDLKDHFSRCDGSPPLPRGKRSAKRQSERKGDAMSAFVCDVCGKDYHRPNSLAIHKKWKHGKAKKRMPRPEPQAAPPSFLDPDPEFFSRLREHAEELRKKAARLEDLAEELVSLL